MKGATLRQLRAFSLIARHRSFGRAAAELHLTPSAVSLQIKELEQTIGMPLFARDGKAVSVTRTGEMLLVDVNRALLALRDADETLARLRGRQSRLVTIGMVSNAKYFLPRVLAQFRAAHPGVELRLSVGNREQLVRQIACGAVELVIMGAPPGELDTASTAFAPQPLGIIAAPNHPLARQRNIPVPTLAQFEFVVREPGSGTRAAMDRFFGEAQLTPSQVMEMSSDEAIKQAVMANMGLAFVSLQTASLELQSGLLVAVDVIGLPVTRRWYVVHLRQEPLSDVAEALRQMIVEHGERMIGTLFQGPPTAKPAEPAASAAPATEAEPAARAQPDVASVE
jgi:DNA-binding transcriptional LysR family regulator